MQPLVSIIMPVHNGEKYIKDSVNSIISQTYNNFELIIIDTSSDSKSYDLINEIADDRIKIIKIDSNKGLTYAFMQGYKKCKGEFITRHDPDDLSSPNRIKRQVEFLNENEEIGMVSCLVKCISDDAFYRKACLFIEKVQNHYIDYESIRNAVLNEFIPIIFPTLLIRKQILEKIQIKEYSKGFDDQIDLLLELLKITKVAKVKGILYTYRRYKNAYHLVNEKAYQGHIKEHFIKSDIKNFLVYKEFYKKNIKRVSTLNYDSPIKILMLIDALNIGGTETHVYNLVLGLMEMGVYVVVGTSGGPLINLFKYSGIKVVNVPMHTDYISNKNLQSKIKLVKDIIDENNINLLHCHLFASMRIGNEIYRKYKIPYVTTIHGLFYPNDVIYKNCLNANGIITVSQPVKTLMNKKFGGYRTKEKVTIIPNGITITDYKSDENIREDLKISKNDIVLVYCSRLAWDKTLAAENFIFAFFKLAIKYNNIHAVVIGDGEGKFIVERESRMLNKTLGREVIHVIGAKFNVMDYYLSSDIVIGTGRVAIEAMSCGKPVIAIGNSGYVGIVNLENKNRQWKTYFGDHDSVEKLDILTIARDLKYLIDNKKERKKIGKWSKKWCKEMFNIELIANDTLSIYKQIIDRNESTI